MVERHCLVKYKDPHKLSTTHQMRSSPTQLVGRIGINQSEQHYISRKGSAFQVSGKTNCLLKGQKQGVEGGLPLEGGPQSQRLPSGLSPSLTSLQPAPGVGLERSSFQKPA